MVRIPPRTRVHALMLRFYFTLIAFAALTALLIAVLWLLDLFRLPGRRPISVLYYRMVCRLLRIRIHVVGERPRDHPALILSNHMSWADILVIGAVTPIDFVAKREVRDWPLIGQAAARLRSVFVDRSRRQQTGDAVGDIAARLKDGDCVVLFAEGTSSDGNRVLQFRSALVGAASHVLQELGPDRHVIVQPLSICYTRLQGLPLGRQHRPLVAWYGDLDFVPHLREFVARGAVDAVVTFGAPVTHGAHANRKELARSVESTVRALTVATLRGRPLPPCAVHFSPENR
jgi:1-acyl-sn-glycerol-3-phosphate acyltransferase